MRGGSSEEEDYTADTEVDDNITDIRTRLYWFGLSFELECEAWRLDTAVHLFSSSLKKLAKLAELEVSLIRLATELKKTQRRANALHHLFIPQYTETITYLENTLEEKERQELFQLKRAKDIHHKVN